MGSLLWEIVDEDTIGTHLQALCEHRRTFLSCVLVNV